ncbi:RNA polymerase sigma factor [Epibacterium ulvae]|uniref:RNA polymerase sigma-70 factor, ECF subfamily n=1 Tax=Epibacterium ulvae TaxID=1156985 RepID=A0A1G5R5W6_9RHOB|nr:RNA polymerase sigma factor [Epibacterium ulvae]SCZ69483.1 RNA polymerase sigma-70 factor, ECF subfamily [Epibacterium ulvae]
MFRTSKAEREIRAALPELYPRLWRYAIALTGRQDWGEELAQATSIRALEQHRHFKAGTHVDRWCFRLAKNIWLNELRARRVRTGNGLMPIEETEIPSTAQSAEANIFAHEVLNSIYALPEAQRVTVLLTYVEGHSYKETADILEIPIGTVMSRLAAARKSLSFLNQDRLEQS